MSDNKIQQVAFCAVFAAGLFVATAFAESEVVDGVEWWYSPEADGVVVEGGDLSERTSVKIPDVLGGCPVTGIGEAAFAECGALETVMLPSSVTRIGSSAFIGCHSLTTVNIPAGVDCIGTGAFYDCESLGEGLVIRDGCLLIANGECPASVEIPAGTRLIAGAAFDGHGEVQSVVIPSGVTVIGDGAFAGCSALSSVSIPSSVSSVGADVFCGCPVENAVLPGRLCGIDSSSLTTLEISPGTTTIGDSAFRGCHALTSITLPSSVGHIGTEAFADCDALCDLSVPQYVCDRWLLDTFPNCESTLTNLVVQEGVTRIADNFCPGSYTLEAVTLPSTIRSIGWCAFSDCYMITSVTIPQLLCNGDYSHCFTQVFRGSLSTLTHVEVLEGTKYIASQTFAGLPELVEVFIPDSVKTIGYEAFAKSPGVYDYTSIPGLVLVDGWIVECLESGIEALDFSSVRGIAEGVTFSGLKNLRSLAIRRDSVDIPHWSFAGCQSLANVCIGGKGVCIGEGAFEDCMALSRVSIADGVSRISPYAFAGCLNLTEVVVPNSVREIGFAAFQGCYNVTNMVLPFVGKERGNNSYTGESCFGYVFGPEWGSTNYSYVATSSVFMASSDFVVSPVLESIRVQDESVLGPQAFYGYSNVVSLVFANCVTNMGAGVFGECTSLTNVTFAGGLSSIGEMAFYRCLGLKEIILPEAVTDVGDHAFADSGIECVVLPDGLKRIGSCAFLYCDSLNEITIPNGVEEVGSCAFFGCHSLTDLSFPQSVTNIGSGVFANCLNLSFWAVDKGNVHYKREGELLLSRSGDRLICAAFDYLGGALPTGVVCVDNYACSCCSLLSEVTVRLYDRLTLSS